MMHVIFRRLTAHFQVREGYWFAPKLYGIGAVPATWQGWLATALFLLLLGLSMRLMPNDAARIAAAAPLVLSFTLLCWLKTDGGWRWRWGPDKD